MDNISSLSPANQVYISSNKENAAKEVTSPIKKGVDKKVVALASVAVGAIALGGLIAAGKFKNAQQLAENINFTPAKTLEEAREFAKKNLHINKFELTDLDSANYINEALVNFNNNISTDHKRVVKMVRPLIKGDPDGSFAMSNFDELIVDENLLKNIGNEIFEYLNNKKEYPIFQSLKFPNVNDLSLKEKMELYDKISTISLNTLNFNDIFANLYSKNSVKEYLKLNKQFPQTIDEFLKLDENSRISIVKKIMKDTKELPVSKNSGGPFRLINHEIGHALHRKNIKSSLFDEYSKYEYLPDGTIDVAKLINKFKNEVGESLFHEIRGNSTVYATITPAEFVAEVYSYLCNGVKFSDDIMNLYNKYGGVLPKTVA